MRSVLSFGPLITLYASTDAATVHRSKPPTEHLRTRQHDGPRALRCPGLDRRTDPVFAGNAFN
jgi:hypothetical protein